MNDELETLLAAFQQAQADLREAEREYRKIGGDLVKEVAPHLRDVMTPAEAAKIATRVLYRDKRG